jgi:hypothetical protein
VPLNLSKRKIDNNDDSENESESKPKRFCDSVSISPIEAFSIDYKNTYNLNSIRKAHECLKKQFGLIDSDQDSNRCDDSRLCNEVLEMLKMKMGLRSAFDEDVLMIEKRLDFTFELRKKFDLKHKAFENISNPDMFPENFITYEEFLSKGFNLNMCKKNYSKMFYEDLCNENFTIDI